MNKIKNIVLDYDKKRIKCFYIGNINLLKRVDFALFCSTKCPGSIIMKTQDIAYQWREKGLVIASGFHSPIEKEVLNVLISGTQSVVICPARSIHNMRISSTWRRHLENRSLLIISPFKKLHERVTKELAFKRNEFVALLGNKVFVPYASSKGKTIDICRKLVACGKVLLTFDDDNNNVLIKAGAKKYLIY